MRGHARTAPGFHLVSAGIAIVSLFTSLDNLAAQTTSSSVDAPVQVGSKVRIQMADSMVQGSVVQIDGHGWEVEVDGLEQERLDLGPGSLARVEVSTGRKTNILKGMGIGLVAGGTSGVFIGLAIAQEDSFFSESFQIGATAMSLGILGVLAGGIIGANPRQQWEEVSPPASLQLLPSVEGRVALSGSLRF